MPRKVAVNNQQSSKVDNRDASYHNVGTVYNAPVNTTIVQDNSVTYEVNPEDTEGLERFSLFLMKRFGEEKTKLVAAISAILAAGSGVGWYKFPQIQILLYATIGFAVLGVAFWTAVQYKYNSRCVKCNTFYAMKPAGSPTVRDVETRGGTRRTTTSTYECRHCGNKVTKKSSELIEPEPDSDD